MSAKIADLKIGIKNQGESAVKDLQDLATSLRTIDRAKKSLDFKDIANRSSQGLQQLERVVQKLTDIMKPLADQMEKISKGVGVLGARKNSASASASGKSGVASATEATNAIPEKLAGLDSTSIDTSRIGALSTTATEASSKLDILRQKLELLKQKYNELSAYPSKALEATNTAYQIKNLEATIKKLEEGKKATTGFAIGLKNVGNELRQTSITSSLANTSIGRLVTSFGRLLKLKLLRMVVMEFYKSIGEGIKNLYEYSRALGSVDSANFKNTMDSYSTSMQTLKNSVGAMIGQVITAMLPTIQTLINYLTTAINVINQFFAALQGKAVFTKAKDSFTEWAEGTSSSAGGASDSIKELQRTILAFDELNVLNSPDTGSGGGGGGGGASTPDYTDMFEEADINEKIKKVADKVKEVIDFIRENFDTIWAIVSNIGLALLAWKIASEVASFFSMLDKLGFTKNAGKIAFGITLSLVGFAIEATGAYDIGKNGANLRNVIQTALGGALGIAGMGIAFGSAGIVASIPIAITVAFMGIYFGEVDALLEASKVYQEAVTQANRLEELKTRTDEIIASINDTSDITSAVTKYAEAEKIIDELFTLLDKDGKTAQDTAQITELVEKLNGLSLYEVKVEYDNLTESINLTKEELIKLNEEARNQAITNAYFAQWEKAYNGFLDLKYSVEEAKGEFKDAKSKLDDFTASLDENTLTWFEYAYAHEVAGQKSIVSFDAEQQALYEQYKQLNDNAKSAKELGDSLVNSAKDASEKADYWWSQYESSASGTMETIVDSYKSSSKTINDSPITPKVNATEAVNRISGIYQLWNNELKFSQKELYVTNSSATGTIDKLKSYWNGTTLVAKSLSINTDSAYSAVNNFSSYWKKLNLQKELGVKVNVTSANGKIVAGGMVFQNYASGGFPDYGTMFIAGENGAGAEMVGNINGRTGVASQGEITGIRQSVEATGNAEARLLAEQNALLRQILAKEGNVTVSTSAIIDGLNRTNRRAGKTVVAMGQ